VVRRAALLWAATTVLGLGVAWGAAFLRLDDLKGEATEEEHQDWIELTSWEQAVSNASASRIRAARPLADLAADWRGHVRLASLGAGRPEFGGLQLTKHLDRTSPKLALACAQGRRFGEARLELMRQSPFSVLLARIDLKEVLVSQLGVEARAAGQVPAESLVLQFGDVTFTVVEVNVSGVPVRQHEAHWDVQEGRGSFSSGPYSGGGGADPLTVMNRNLLVNPGAEAGVGAADLLAVAAPPGWETTGALTALRYDATGSPFAGDLRGPENRGNNLFVGGPDSATSLARQLVDVAAAAPMIDERRLKAVLEAWLGAAAEDEDRAQVTARYFRSDGTPLGQMELGPLPSHARHRQTALVSQQGQSAVPPGTRTIEVTIRVSRFTGTYNDGAADNLSLTLLEGSAGPPKLPLRVWFTPGAGPGQAAKLTCAWPAGLAAVVIEQSASPAEGWTPSQPEVRVEGDERMFEIPVDAVVPVRFWRLRAE
jgi:type VI secretion system secreted protein Hcp